MSLRPRPVNFDSVWPTLHSSVQGIVTCSKIERTVWDNRFDDIYMLCVAIPENHSERLYNQTRDFLEKHVTELFKTVSLTDETLLQSYFDKWLIYSKGCKYLHNLYGYLNTQYIKKHKFTEADLNYGGISAEQMRTCMLEIGELGLDIWRRLMIAPLEKTLVTLLLDAIRRDRDGEAVSQTVVSGVIQSFVEVEQYKLKAQLELYETLFEKRFLDATAEHYKQEASLLSAHTCSAYMEKVLSRLEEEDLRARRFLHPSSFEKVRKECEKVMVANNLDQLNSVAEELILREQKHDLGNMYKLLKSIPRALDTLIRGLELHIKKIALNLVQSLEGENVPNQFVENMLNLHHKYKELVQHTFQNDQEFSGALDRACVAAINHKDERSACSKASEWLARYTDYLLKKSAKGMSESDIEDKLTYAITIFRYIEDKDMFQKFYSRMLATRLIHSASVSMDAEECMINKLKQACGYEFTSKLHRMFQDMGVSKTLSDQFEQHLANEGEQLQMGFQIQILQAGAWPLSGQGVASSFSVPPDLQPAIRLFEGFYSRNFSGRKLTWLYNFATADVKLGYLPRSYTITCQVYQLAILLHFNSAEEAIMLDLEIETQLDKDVLARCIRPLLEAGLLIETEGSGAMRVRLNTQFVSKRTKLRIAAPVVQRQVEKEAEHVNVSVQQDRKYFLECTIVRIMKARKVLKHNQLLNEVITQCRTRFTPEVSFIKKTIEQLIDKLYLQRTENPDEYAYLA